MIIEYKIDEEQLLVHQLYAASKSERIKRKRKRNWLVVPVVYVAIALLFFVKDNSSTAIAFLMIAALWLLFYPVWEKRYYINHYKGFIKENNKELLGRIATLDFSNEFILAKENGSETKILTTELEEINEIPSTIFVKLRGGQSFIIPKSKIANIDDLITILKELAHYLQIRYVIDENWEWK